MRAVIVSYGHVDPVLPLFKNIGKYVDCDLILVFSQRQKRESILSFEDVDVKDGFLAPGTTAEILGRIGLDDHGGRISIFVYHNNRTRSLKNLWLSLRLFRRLKKYDLIHFNGQHTTMIHLLCLLPAKTRRLFTIHDFKPHSGEGGKHKWFACFWYNSLILRKKWPAILQNRADFNLARRENPHACNRLFYIPLGIFTSYRYWTGATDIGPPYDLLFFGRISRYKGLPCLLAAVVELQKTRPDLSLCIAGAGDISAYGAYLRQAKNCTVINDYVPSSELVMLLRKAKIVVCPYTDATQSGVVMTAFAFNKPVIASDVGGFSEVIRDGKTGMLFKAGDAKELKEKISNLLDDEPLRMEMAKNIAAFGESPDFNWDGIARKYARLYEGFPVDENSACH